MFHAARLVGKQRNAKLLAGGIPRALIRARSAKGRIYKMHKLRARKNLRKVVWLRGLRWLSLHREAQRSLQHATGLDLMDATRLLFITTYVFRSNRRLLRLPMYYEIGTEEQARVCAGLRESLRRNTVTST